MQAAWLDLTRVIILPSEYEEAVFKGVDINPVVIVEEWGSNEGSIVVFPIS